MNFAKLIFALIFTVSIQNLSYSQTPQNYRKLELSNKLVSQNNQYEKNKIEENYNQSIQANSNEKSPYLGALFSGLIPGTGEIYAKSYIKGAIFLAIETGLWIVYANNESKGDDQTVYYQNYANQNWDVYKYADWLKQQNFSGSSGIDLNADKETLRRQINVCEAQNFSHQLPHYGEQQYYELIGKYQNYVPGWADADLTYVNSSNYAAYKTGMFTDYSYERQSANDYYDNASTSLTLIIVNHILSAADAAWSVSMFNKDLKVKTSMKMQNKYSSIGEKKLLPVANLNITF